VQVSDVMSSRVLTVEPGTPVKEVARILVERRISGLPVVEVGRVIGVVTDRDMLEKLEPESPQQRRLWRLSHRRRARADQARRQAQTAAQAMSSPAVMIRPSASIAEAARLMLEHDVNRLPVVDDGQRFGPTEPEQGQLCGIVTHADLMRAFIRPDEDIAAEIDQLLELEWIPPGTVSYTIKDGAVRLSCQVEQAIIAETLSAGITRIAGVTGVDSELTWREPVPDPNEHFTSSP
jgi:CBS domain-containing protein